MDTGFQFCKVNGILEVGVGDGCLTMGMSLLPRNGTVCLKMVKMEHFVFCPFYHNEKKSIG